MQPPQQRACPWPGHGDPSTKAGASKPLSTKLRGSASRPPPAFRLGQTTRDPTLRYIFIYLFTGSGLPLLDLGSARHSLRGSEFKGLAPQLPPRWARPRSARGRAPVLTPFLLALFLLRTPRQRPAPAGKKSPPPPLTNAPLIGGLRPASAQSPASAVAMATVDAARPGPPWPPTAPGCWWATGTRRRSWRR